MGKKREKRGKNYKEEGGVYYLLIFNLEGTIQDGP